MHILNLKLIITPLAFPEGWRLNGFTPTEHSDFLNFVLEQNTVQALLPCSLNPNCCTGKTLKIVH